jgi:hypothetical protein
MKAAMRTAGAVLLFFMLPFSIGAQGYGASGAALVSPEALPPVRINEAERILVLDHLGDLDIAGESRDALITAFFSMSGANYLPPGVTVVNGNYEAICAMVVSRLFWAVFGGEDDLSTARGVSGDAWNMARNVSRFGGRVFPWDENAAALLRTGDIIGLYYVYSIYNNIEKPRDYTHLALVIDNVPGRGALLGHWWSVPARFIPDDTPPPWFFRVEFLDDLLRGFPGFFTPREVIRPKNVFTAE